MSLALSKPSLPGNRARYQKTRNSKGDSLDLVTVIPSEVACTQIELALVSTFSFFPKSFHKPKEDLR
jgi:hypothetical protein